MSVKFKSPPAPSARTRAPSRLAGAAQKNDAARPAIPDEMEYNFQSFDLPKLVEGVEGYQHYAKRDGIIGLLAPKRRNRHTVLATQVPIENGSLEDLQSTGGLNGSEAAKRVTLVSTNQTGKDTFTWMSRFVLDNESLRELLSSYRQIAKKAILSFYNSSPKINELAEFLDARLDGLNFDYAKWGAKSGNRESFERAGVQFPAGVKGQIRSVDDLVQGTPPKNYGLLRLMQDNPEHDVVMFKLDEGLSGEGNSRINLKPLRELISHCETAEEQIEVLKNVFHNLVHTTQVMQAVGDDGVVFEKHVNFGTYNGQEIVKIDGEVMTWPKFVDELDRQGAIAELFVKGVTQSSPSPSGQGRILEDGTVEFISYHLQILDPNNIYLGCKLPPSPAMYKQIRDAVMKVGAVLSEEGVRGRFALDFVATSKLGPDGQPLLFLDSDGNKVPLLDSDGLPLLGADGKVVYEIQWDLHAIENNVRGGGTTHTFHALEYLVGGEWNDDGKWIVDGKEKSYVAMDNVIQRALRWLKPEDVLDIIKRHGLAFDHETKRGICPFLVDLAGGYGKLGATCIGNGTADAENLLRRFEEALEEESRNRVGIIPAYVKMGVETGKGNGLDQDDESLFRTPLTKEIKISRDVQLGGAATDFIREAVYSPNGKRVVTARNLKDGAELVVLRVDKPSAPPQVLKIPELSSIRTMAASQDQLLVATPQSEIVAMDWSGQPKWSIQLPAEDGMVNRLTYSPQGDVVAVGLSSGTVRFLNVKTGTESFRNSETGQEEPIRPIEGAQGWVRSQCYSSDGKRFAVGDDGGVVRVFDTSDSRKYSQSSEFKLDAPVNSLAMTSEQSKRKLVAVTSRNEMFLMDLEKNEVVSQISHNWPLGEVSFSPDGKTVSAVGQNGELVMYELVPDEAKKIITPVPIKVKRGPIIHERTVGPTHFTKQGHLRLLSNTGALKEVSFHGRRNS